MKSLIESARMSKNPSNQIKPSLIEIPSEFSSDGSLRSRIYAELKRLILSGKVAPGEHLPEARLCNQLNVSRTPLREALNQLGNENLVLFRPNSGYLVAPLSSEEAKKLLELRRIVEPKVASMAAVVATLEEVNALRAAAEMPQVKEGDDASFANFSQKNAFFHLLLCRCVNNHLLEHIVMSSLDVYQRPAYLGIGRVTNADKATRCHHDIVDAIEARDPLKAETAMCNHVISGSERIIKALIEAGY
jgi:DNA-binding GntR family transcriptional regulator